MDRVLAVDLGGTKTAVGIVSGEGEVLAKRSAPTPLGDPAAALDRIVALARAVLEEAGPAEALGIALPGVVDRGAGLLLRSPSSGWRNVPFVSMAEKALGLPAEADNDVNACAWAEARFGAARGMDCFFWMTVSTGIGGAVVAGGRVLAGANAMAGEIGHLVVNPGGEACGCGHRGCLEAEAAGPAWRRKALRLLDARGVLDAASGAGGNGHLADVPRDALDAKALADSARAGDTLGMAVVRDVGSMLARGIAAVSNILDPDAVIVGGGVAGALDLLLPVIADECAGLTFAASERRMSIRPSALGYDAALIGAAALAIFPY